MLPKSIICLRDYNRQKLAADLFAGVTVGLVALPLAMAFAISSGVPPQAGIYTAIVAGFLISALGGSKTQIGGPTGAFVVIVYGIVAKYGIDGLYICTLMAGLILFLLGVTGLGTTVKYIPRPVIVGFTNGIAVLIASTQLKDFFGLTIDNVPGEFLARMEAIATHLSTISLRATVISVSINSRHHIVPQICAARSGIHCRDDLGNNSGSSYGIVGRNHRHTVWRNPYGAALAHNSTF